MLVVPIRGDKIKTADSSDVRIVSSYTSLKDQPAVYLEKATSADAYVYFSDIVEINGVRVEYESGSKLFSALGPLKRKYNLPQPRDTIKIKLIDTAYKQEIEEVEVDSLKLHNKTVGATRGLMVCSKEANYPLSEVLEVEHKNGYEKFDKDKFCAYYIDYLPISAKSKG
jgi:hypothetical protein